MTSLEAGSSSVHDAAPHRCLPFSLPMVPPIVMAADFLLVLLATAAPIMLLAAPGHEVASSRAALSSGAVTAALILSISCGRHLYDIGALRTPRRQSVEIALISLVAWILIRSVVVAFDGLHAVPLLSLAAGTACAAAAVVAHRLIWARLIAGEDATPRLRFQPVALLIIGNVNRQWLARAFATSGMQIAGECHLTSRQLSHPGRRQVRLREFAECANRSRIEAAYVAYDANQRIALQTVAAELPELASPVRVLSCTDADLLPGCSVPIRLGRLVAFELRGARPSAAERIQKRLLDVFGALAALLLFAPVMVLVAIAIKLDSGGPIIFKQRRMGLHGSMFLIYKFRSMSVQEDGPSIRQASRDDPRLTRVGRWIRASSIDELPQLFNVLLGSMSLVGPRPHALAHEVHYEALIPGYGLRRRMKPGMTGWAQIHGHRGETPTTEHMRMRVHHDVWYVRNWSLWLDLRILLATPLALRG